MRLFSKLGLTLFVSTSLFITGCQPFVQSPAHVSQQVEAENQFNLQGKIGVRTPQQSGSAFFTWVQQQQQFDIELSGILGVGKTQISGQPGQVTLNSAKTGIIYAESPEELLEQATGWQAPITHLVDWVQARPATVNAQIQKDPQQRPTQFIEDGWTVDLSYNDSASLPNRLILKQALESGQENRITMLIQNR
ncbi:MULTISPECIES: lipoprotein insertase outer membrane protein LolB [Acinetobacter]|jgi:outer membrane lipoprotein LolB|uniref:Outer-membrane lipoprotein LolB n=1 Tax=Acinetobacter towneri TaxID=202956 RepID=A0AAP9GV53_9GAMM|nr:MULTISPECIES: lipoprotein insertase outer membrane protein LolB [Acinetobacter]MCA4815421.1 outer membrane lipoprotein LolB [Acinetobacter towneri]QGM28203.1 outer membrane lipoprotein LolB [Acinetobacter towneri]QIV91888.1 outer membrane lipoprotein LolB [Acinetobacter towneri]QTD63827.1 outer membrane lipoprotein LolB [Acinetobacter towneri]UNT62503.1 outer membrane lipoprotein LolB [Acinetobacter towneri]